MEHHPRAYIKGEAKDHQAFSANSCAPDFELWACLLKCLDILLSAGAIMHYHEDTYECFYGNCKIQMPLHTAAALGYVECLKVLLNHINDPNQKPPRNETLLDCTDHYQTTAFGYAAYYRQTECMKILLEAGASPFVEIRNGDAFYGALPLPDVPFTSIGAVIHHNHVCKECKLQNLYQGGELEQPIQDYSEYQPCEDSKKCHYCETGECDCDSLENSLEIFSVAHMSKFIGKIPRMSMDAIMNLLQEGLSESIHLVRPEPLRLTLQFGADPHQPIKFRYDRCRNDDIRYARGVSVTTVLDRLVCQEVQLQLYQYDNSLVVSAISFLQWVAMYNRSPCNLKKERNA